MNRPLGKGWFTLPLPVAQLPVYNRVPYSLYGEIMDAWRAGAQHRELAEQYGVTRQAIGKIIQRVNDGKYGST